jgi:hypothetical protein
MGMRWQPPCLIRFFRAWSRVEPGTLRRRSGANLNERPLRGLFWLRFSFFDEEDRDSVDDRVENLAVRAAEVVGLFQLQPGMALGARQDFEQFARDHLRMVVGFRQ